MREPKRIKTICELIEKAMMIEPDILFGQILVNCGYLIQKEVGGGFGMGEWREVVTSDPFNYEDERLINCLDKYIKKHSK